VCLPSELCDCCPFLILNWQGMSGHTVDEILDKLWNKSGDEENISGDEFEQSGENDEDYLDESET